MLLVLQVVIVKLGVYFILFGFSEKRELIGNACHPGVTKDLFGCETLCWIRLEYSLGIVDFDPEQLGALETAEVLGF